jgi:hypothetical protein
MDPRIIDRTLQMLKDFQQPLALQKAGIDTTLGIVAYDLEPAAKLLYPVITPLRNEIPRASAQPGAGLAVHWKQITGINTANVRAGLAEGNRGGVITLQEADMLGTHKAMGLENSVTFEAELAARGFDDARALAGLTLLQSVMIQEEITDLNGNNSMALGVTGTPVGTAVATGGSLAATTYFLFCVAMTQQAFLDTSRNFATGTNAGLSPTITRTNADGSTDTFGGGIGQISVASAGVTTVAGGSITATVPATKGAFAYAWFIGTAATPASCNLVAITPINAVTITAVPTGTLYNAGAVGLSADNSRNTLDYDGLIAQALNSTGYYKSLDNATLTADGAGGCAEIDTALQFWWDNYRISPSIMWVSGAMRKNITTKIVVNGGTPIMRVNLETGRSDQGNVVAGTVVGSYLNKFAMGGTLEIPIRLHPYMSTNAIFFDLDIVPYPNANVPAARRLLTRQEYYQIEWPLVTRKYQYGVYFDGVLQAYVPFGMGLIANIKLG